MIKLLIGGSPCTYWSVAQTKNREIKAEGAGWELFKNFLIAKEKFQPDYFLYENNKSAADPIKKQISKELGVDLMFINSALVSAQNRERFYAFNWSVEEPADRKIFLKDILEHGIPWNQKSYCITASYNGAVIKNTLLKRQRTMVAEPIAENKIVKLGNFRNSSQTNRIHSIYGKSPCLCAGVPSYIAYDSKETDKFFPVYQVKNEQVDLRGKICPIKLPDGYYIIRKLTPIECERLQTLPDNYTCCVSNTQRYKCLGNGWTAEVIIHILKKILEPVPKSEKILVLSMYDGIATGRYCLEKLGFENIEYHAFEIDPFAKKVAMFHFPDIIQRGDAFQVRENTWSLT